MAFSITQVPGIAITFVVIAVVLGVGATILVQIQSGQCTYGYANGQCVNSTGGTGGDTGATYAANITASGLQAQTTLASWQATWIVIVASAVVIGVIAGYLMMR